MHSDDLFDMWGDVLAFGEDEQVSDSGGPLAMPDAAGTHEALYRPLPDPFVDDLGIEYWIWNGSRLVPAWPDEVERIRAGEDMHREHARQQMQGTEEHRQRRVSRRLAAFGRRVWKRCAVWLGIPPALQPRESPRHRSHPRQPDA
jgi:hypothetical protein